MANFCTKCGKKMEEGVIHTCDNENVTVAPISAGNSNAASEYFNQIVDIAKNIVTKPVDTVKKYAKSENFVLGIIAIVLCGLLLGLFAYVFADKALGDAGNYLYLLLGDEIDLGDAKIPFASTVFKTALFGIVSMFGLVCGVYLFANVIFKDTKLDSKKVVAGIGTASVLMSLLYVVYMLCVLISYKVLVYACLAGSVLYIGYLYHTISKIVETDENKMPYIFLGAEVVSTLLVYILFKIMF